MNFTRIALTTITAMTLGTTAMAASTGTLLLQGTVGLINDIVVTPNTANNTSLDIVSGETDKDVASVAETSNSLSGYKIKISSATNGELRHTVDANKKTSYQIGYDGQAAVTPTSTGVVVKTVSSLNGLTTDTSAVTVNVAALPSAVAGTYQDTLTISIEAN